MIHEGWLSVREGGSYHFFNADQTISVCGIADCVDPTRNPAIYVPKEVRCTRCLKGIGLIAERLKKRPNGRPKSPNSKWGL